MIKDKIEIINNAAFVEVFFTDFISGQIVSAKMLLDTGAKFTILDKGFLQRLGYNDKKAPKEAFLGYGGKERVGSLVKIKGIKLHKLKRKNFEVLADDMPLGFLMYCSGILGLDFFLNQSFTINLKTKEFNFN